MSLSSESNPYQIIQHKLIELDRIVKFICLYAYTQFIEQLAQVALILLWYFV